MIISMKLHATKQEIDAVCDRIKEFGYKVHSIAGEERCVIGAVGVGDVTACLESLEATPGVESAMRISAPYKFVSREFKKERSAIRVNGVEIGGGVAGPRRVIGSFLPTYNAPPTFTPVTGGNVSAAFHFLARDGKSEFYAVYGDPNSFSTTPAVFLKYIRYIGAPKGT